MTSAISRIGRSAKEKKIFWRKFQTFVNLQKFEFRAKLLFFLLRFCQSGKWQTSPFEFLNNALAPIFWHWAGNHKMSYENFTIKFMIAVVT